jgi:hypothetical protein
MTLSTRLPRRQRMQRVHELQEADTGGSALRKAHNLRDSWLSNCTAN